LSILISLFYEALCFKDCEAQNASIGFLSASLKVLRVNGLDFLLKETIVAERKFIERAGSK
jgi:hypothetical protein